MAAKSPSQKYLTTILIISLVGAGFWIWSSRREVAPTPVVKPTSSAQNTATPDQKVSEISATGIVAKTLVQSSTPVQEVAPTTDPGVTSSKPVASGTKPADVTPPKITPPASSAATQPAKSESPNDYGLIPPVQADANASTRSVVDALKNKNHPERLSPLVAPAPYNDAEFLKNPQDYCDTVEPGRVFQSAQPSATTPRLELASESLQQVAQGDAVALQVRSVPGKPVTFVAFDGGRFRENQLNTVTVVADASGTATARFEATTGVIDEVKILAASPVASGQASFCVYVSKKASTQP